MTRPRIVLALALALGCGGTAAPSPTTPAAPVVAAARPAAPATADATAPTVDAGAAQASAPRDPEHRGALCFGGTGATDVRTFDDAAIRILEQHQTITAIGSCALRSSHGMGLPDLEVIAGSTVIAVLDLCGAEVRVPGVSYDGGPEVGDSTQAIAAYSRLECRPDTDGYWCDQQDEYDAIDRYFVAVPGTVARTGVTVTGAAAVQLLTGKTIARASFGTRCD